MALKLAQEVSHTDAETYIFDVMADNYFAYENYAKAKDLYLEVVQRMSMKPDFSTDNEGLVEISSKLAYCFSELNQIEEAEQGFQFTLASQLKRTSSFWNNKTSEVIESGLEENELSESQKNSLSLLGMSYDLYSKHLCRTHSLQGALLYRLKALAISRKVNGNQHEQTAVLLNDIAQLYVDLNDYDNAKKYLKNAIDASKEIESPDLSLYYVNLASVYHQQNRADLVQANCRSASLFINLVKQEFNDKEYKTMQHKIDSCLKGEKFY